MTEAKRTMLILAAVGALALFLFLRRSSSDTAPPPLLVQHAPPAYDSMGMGPGGSHVGAPPPGTIPAPGGSGGPGSGGNTLVGVHPPTYAKLVHTGSAGGGAPKPFHVPPAIIGGHPGPQQNLSPVYGFEPWITGGAR